MLTCDALPALMVCSQKATGLSNASHTLHPKEGHTGEWEVFLYRLEEGLYAVVLGSPLAKLICLVSL